MNNLSFHLAIYQSSKSYFTGHAPIQPSGFSLYNLEKDPFELNNFAERQKLNMVGYGISVKHDFLPALVV